MKKSILTLAFAISFILGYSQITITEQPDQGGPPKACEGTDVNLSVTTAAAGLTYQWEVKYNTPLISNWTALNAFIIKNLSSVPGFSTMQIINYTTNSITIQNVTHLVDSLQIRCKIKQAISNDSVYTTEPYITVYSLPGIDLNSSVFKGCEPTDINLKLDTSYTPLQLTTCRFLLTENGSIVDSINNNNPATIASSFTYKPDSIVQDILLVYNKLYPVCTKKDTFTISVQKVYQSEKIAMVTYDLTSSKWQVLWNKTINVGTDSGRVMQVEPISSIIVGGISYVNSPYGIFTDLNTSTNIQPAYSIIVVDTCKHVSGFSPIHKPIYLQTDTINNTIKFSWNPYFGIGYAKHYIHVSSIRDSVYSTSSIIDSVASTDTTYILKNPVKNSYYAISMKLNTPLIITSILKAESGPYSQSLSNITEYQTQEMALKEISLKNLTVSPNPFTDKLNVNVSIQKPGLVFIEVINSIGTKIMERNLGPQDPGNHLFSLSFDENAASGLYFIKVTVNGDSQIVKAYHIN